MSEFDDKLAAFFAEARPSARDPAFCAAVLQAAERRRLQEDLMSLALLGVSGAAIFSAIWPIASPLLASLASGLAPAAGAAFTALAVIWLAGRTPAARA